MAAAFPWLSFIRPQRAQMTTDFGRDNNHFETLDRSILNEFNMLTLLLLLFKRIFSSDRKVRGKMRWWVGGRDRVMSLRVFAMHIKLTLMNKKEKMKPKKGVRRWIKINAKLMLTLHLTHLLNTFPAFFPGSESNLWASWFGLITKRLCQHFG